MSPREQAAFAAGIEIARQMALTVEVRDDAQELRQQAAVVALQGLASGLKDAFLDPAAPEGQKRQVNARG